jgi:arginase
MPKKRPLAKRTVQIVGVPMDLGAGRRGVDMGPSAIRIAGIAERLRGLGYDVVDNGDLKIRTQEELRVTDPKAKYLAEITRSVTTLAEKVALIVRAKQFPLVLGGDHSVAIGTISGIASEARRLRKRLGVLWIDAHADFNTPESSPSGNIHGMPLAVCVGHGPRKLRMVGGRGQKIDPHHVAIIGLRSVDPTERKHLVSHGVHLFTMGDIDKRGMNEVVGMALKEIVPHVDMLHVSLDLDAVDPVYAPGVGTPVKGGLDYREAHLCMECIADSGRMTSMEVVEVNPILDNRNQSAEFAVELVQSAFGKKIL